LNFSEADRNKGCERVVVERSESHR
jgi:hypothetical protein